MNVKNVRKQVLNAILERGVIDNGNVVGTLTDKAQVNGIQGRDKVISALDTLERNDVIGVIRRGSHILKVFPKTKESCEWSDRTDRSPAAKREGMFAKGIPANLPDEWCTPVIVIKKEDRELVTPNDMPAKKSDKEGKTVVTEANTAVEPAAEPTSPSELSFLEMMNLAYMGLLHRADPETGKLPVGSVHAFIKEDLKDQNPSTHRIKMLNWTLGQLGLRTTAFFGSTAKKGGGRRSPTYQSAVDVKIDAITQEMLDSLKTSPEPVEENDEALVPVVSDDISASPEDVTKKLVEIIKELEKQITSLKEANRKEVNQLTHDLRTAQAEIAKLKASTVDPEVASFLEKYRKV